MGTAWRESGPWADSVRAGGSGVDVLHQAQAGQERALHEEEQNHDRQGRQKRSRHQIVPLRTAELALIELKPERERERVLVGQIKERPQKVVPRIDELE